MANIEKFISAEYIDTVVVREDGRSGVLHRKPLLLYACEAGAYGGYYPYDGGSVAESLFTYLCGKPCQTFFDTHRELFYGHLLVAMTDEWEAFLQNRPEDKLVMTRWMMLPKRDFAEHSTPISPIRRADGYEIRLFDEKTFGLHPFGHGLQYADYAAFEKNGSGAVAWYEGTAAASASSFFTYRNGVELDVSTEPKHRRKGLAEACVRMMLDDCTRRGITVHWDAQNLMSKRLAEKCGFVFEEDYAVTMLAAE